MADTRRGDAAGSTVVPAALLGVLGGFQAGLALGLPWGAASYGGSHLGVPPPRLRATSAAAVPVYVALAATVATGPLSPPARRRLHTGLTALFGLASVVNTASPSRPERLLWGPTAAVLALSLWRSRGSGE